MRTNRAAARTAAVIAIAVAAAAAAADAAPKAKQLVTTRVTVYDCGLMQLEREAAVQGAVRLELDLSLAQLDDALATLVVATDGTVEVRSASFPRVLNLAQAAAASGLGLALTEGGDGVALPTEVADLTARLAGTRVEIALADGRRLTGVVLTVAAGEPRPLPAAEGSAPAPLAAPSQVAVVTDDGAVTFVPLEKIASIRPASEPEARALGDLAARLGRASGAGRAPVVLETSAGSRGRLAVSYVQESPLWRMSYRVVARKGRVALEAWAIVHNDTAEDWRDVELTLVSGLPTSYVASLASPRFQSRELYAEEAGEMTPQLGAQTADALLYGFSAYRLEGAGGLGLSGYGYGGGGSGEGTIGYGAAGTVGHGAGGGGESESSLIEVGAPAAAVAAEARVEGEIATYRALRKVTIPAGTSAAVPVLRRELPGEVFTLVEAGAAPRTCARVENGTGLVIQAGMASFYVDGRFRGETPLARTQPEEIGVWCFGADPDVSASFTADEEMAPELLEWRGGTLYAHGRKRTALAVTVDNAAGQPRLVAIDVRHLANGRIVTPGRIVAGDAPGRSLVLVEAPARADAVHAIEVEEGVRKRIPIELESLAELATSELLPAEQRQAVVDAHAFLAKAEQLEAERARREAEAQAADAKRERLQAALAAVPPIRGKIRSVDRILGQIAEEGERAVALREQAEGAEKRAEQAREAALQRLAAIAAPRR